MYEEVELNDEIITSLKEKHGDKLNSLDFEEQSVVFKRPSWAVYSRSLDQLTDDDASKSKAIRELVDACVVFPEKDKLKVLLDEYPGMAGTISKAIQKEAGLDLKKTARKL